MRQRTPPSELISFGSHVTSIFQGLSLSPSVRRVGENPGNEVDKFTYTLVTKMTNFTTQITNSLIYWCTNTCGNLTHNITKNDNFLIHSLAAWNNNWSRFQGRIKKKFYLLVNYYQTPAQTPFKGHLSFQGHLPWSQGCPRDVTMISRCRINTTSRGGGGVGE